MDTPAARRRRLLEVLNPGGSITYPHLDRAVSLAMTYGWQVEPALVHRVRPVAASQRTRTIYTTPIVGDSELALFVHEGGHIEDSVANGRRHQAPHASDVGYLISVDAEIAAWRWAMPVIGWRWNKTMQATMETALRSYARYLETADERRAMDAVIADGFELSRHIIRVGPPERKRA
jgi:hypothetical protein